ncbi:MAG: precorrin-2 C(20)-methyltransferase [Actinobacteria bacterium]|nr:precorrin-2 C(20)-methyltransferase [Actinomycetota bacterium]MCL5446185.1 precorrin-2 C(20)-methyltransferase [Actinomycetota bacterium]
MIGHRNSEYPVRRDTTRTGNAGTLFGVGVGPGSPDLMTLRAVEVLERVAHVLAPSTSLESPGRAELTVSAVMPGISVERFAFPMSTSTETAVRRSADGKPTAARQPVEQVYGDLAKVIAEYTANREDVAFITIGDPDIYSTFTRLRQRVLEIRPDCIVETIPGICAFQELAARTNTTLSTGDEQLTIIAHLHNADVLNAALSDAHQSVVVYKGGTRLPEVASAIEKAGRTNGSVLGVHLGQEGEYICGIDEAPPRPTPYLSTLIVPPARGQE